MRHRYDSRADRYGYIYHHQKIMKVFQCICFPCRHNEKIRILQRKISWCDIVTMVTSAGFRSASKSCRSLASRSIHISKKNICSLFFKKKDSINLNCHIFHVICQRNVYVSLSETEIVPDCLVGNLPGNVLSISPLSENLLKNVHTLTFSIQHQAQSRLLTWV